MTLGTKGLLAGISMIAILASGTVGVRANDSVLKAQSEAGQWAVAGHDYSNTRFSPLKQINAENAGKLSLAYSFSLGSLRSSSSHQQPPPTRRRPSSSRRKCGRCWSNAARPATATRSKKAA